MVDKTYTLKHRGYYEVLGRVAEAFGSQGIPYALVGGSGVQARIADLFCQKRNVDITGADGLEFLLRATKDLDITSQSSEEDMSSLFNFLQSSNPNITIESAGRRRKRVSIISNQKRKDTVFVNYQTGPQDFAGLDDDFYNACLGTAEVLHLPYRNSSIPVKVGTPECIIASKLTRSSSKDIWDIAALLKTIKLYGNKDFNSDLVKGYLQNSGHEEYFGRLEEIKKQILQSNAEETQTGLFSL